jgi:hypothetical protein
MEHTIFYHKGGKTKEEAQKILDAFIANGVDPVNTIYECNSSDALYVAIDDRLEAFTSTSFVDYFKEVGVKLPVFFGKFKTGDYVVNTLEGFIGIVDTCAKDEYTFKATLSILSLEVSYDVSYDVSLSSEDVLRKATKAEADILDSFLAKENKVYNSETNQLEEIEDTNGESSYTPKPFDKVLGWDNDESNSYPDIFFECVEDSNYHYRCARGGYKHVKPYKE